ncbi:10252_t:CDS:2 [Dentiscutata erythropus]|uniref:10252_t:CDS:1 n=1 Tax=Dentiscutata erythropus TaxID=1348616 RepID=A0A9N9IAA6_9GLOM|nr:10252_t:CDS:2 [Dentiscutata erythropus]
MQAHLNNNCLEAPKNAKTNSKSQKKIQTNTLILYTSTSSHTSKWLKTIPIKNFLDHIDEEKQKSLEFILTQALFATGVSFSFLKNPYMIKFFQHIRPVFKLPNWKKLANELVDKKNNKYNSKYFMQFSDKIQTCIEAWWNYVYYIIIMVAYMLDPRFLEESRIYNIEAIEYNIFTTFTNQKFEQEKSVELFIEIIKFQNKSFPYNNNIIWESATILNPDSSLKQLAIKVLKIPTSSAAAEQNFSTFGFIHSKLRNRLNNNQVKKLVYIYENLQIHVEKPVNNKTNIRINNNKTNQEINQEIYNEDNEVEDIIYTEGICESIEEIEQIYSSDIDNISMMELELLNNY